MQADARRTARLSLIWLVAILACFAVPASASATTVTVRIEGATAPIFPSAPVTLPTGAVTDPSGSAPTDTCAGNTVIGALDVATSHGWAGTWTDGSGWSIDTIKGQTALLSAGREWLVLRNDQIPKTSPCNTTLSDGDKLTLFPACVSATTKCFKQGPLEILGPGQVGPGAPLGVTVYEVDLMLAADGTGEAQQTTSEGALVTGPDGYTYSDSHYGTGQATLSIIEKGPAVITASKPGFVPTQHDVCVTDGEDGFCGTSAPPQVPFNPLDYCQTTGSDGYCGSPDKVAPLGRIVAPKLNQAFGKGGGPTKFNGTVDFDPSLTDHVNLRLMRQITVKVTKYKKRKVWVTTRSHGKKVRKRVTRRKAYKVKRKACYYWSDSSSDWRRMKKCDASTARQFRATGAEVWSYEFLSHLPSGAYTFDVLAVDGAGNMDTTMELGRNRVTFKVG